MADIIISPNMNLPVPVVGVDAGPDWANNVNASLNAIDSHNHSAGQGVPITPDGMNISSDLPFGGNSATGLLTATFDSQVAPLSASTYMDCIYVSGEDLYYNDESGNQVRITQGGSVTGSTGTITGLPSGTASASYSAGTFTFQSATSTPAIMAVGPIVTGAQVASAKTITLSASSSQPADYAMTWPTALPASTSLLSVDVSGNMGLVTTTGSGSIVRATSPTITTPSISGGTFTSPLINTPTITDLTLSGNPSGSLESGVFTPTTTWRGVVTVADQKWYYTRVGEIITVAGYMDISGSVLLTSTTLPLSTASLIVTGTVSINNDYFIVPLAGSGTTLVVPRNTIGTISSGPNTITFQYTYRKT